MHLMEFAAVCWFSACVAKQTCVLSVPGGREITDEGCNLEKLINDQAKLLRNALDTGVA